MKKKIQPQIAVTRPLYVTYHWLQIYGPGTGLNRPGLRAVECQTREQLLETASDLCSYHGIRNVRINLCGRLPKGTKIIKYEDYKKDSSIL